MPRFFKAYLIGFASAVLLVAVTVGVLFAVGWLRNPLSEPAVPTPSASALSPSNAQAVSISLESANKKLDDLAGQLKSAGTGTKVTLTLTEAELNAKLAQPDVFARISQMFSQAVVAAGLPQAIELKSLRIGLAPDKAAGFVSIDYSGQKVDLTIAFHIEVQSGKPVAVVDSIAMGLVSLPANMKDQFNRYLGQGVEQVTGSLPLTVQSVKLGQGQVTIEAVAR